MKRRIHVYGEQTAPLLDYYTQAGLLVEVDGTREIDQVASDLLAAINRE